MRVANNKNNVWKNTQEELLIDRLIERMTERMIERMIENEE